MEICYDKDFWKDFEILMFDRDRMGETPQDVNSIIELMGIKKNEELLDVCCGFGRHSNILAKRGIKVTGIDFNKEYIHRAITEKPCNDNPNFLHKDLLKLDFKDKFSYAINLFTSFGLLESEEDEIIGLKNVYKALKPGGKYLIDIQGKELMIRDYEKNIWFESGDVKVFLEYTILNSFTTLRSRWLYYKDDIMHEKSFDTRVYSALELGTLLSETGFKSVDIYGDLKGNSYDINAKRLIAVATK